MHVGLATIQSFALPIEGIAFPVLVANKKEEGRGGEEDDPRRDAS